MGLACTIALEAARRGAAVELVGRAGDDPAGDALLIALARGGVGHIAVLRDPARPTLVVEAAPDLDDDERADGGVLGGDVDVPAAAPDPRSHPTLEPEDVDLGLRYITAFSVLIVLDDVPAGVIAVAADAASFAEAHLVLLAREGTTPPDGLPAATTVLGAPDSDPDGAFATLVGAYAAALDAGATSEAAFAAALGAGWETPAP